MKNLRILVLVFINLGIQKLVLGQSGLDTIKLYGYPLPQLYLNAQNLIGRELGVRFIYVAGCTVSSSEMDSIESLNQITFSNISSRIGSDWRPDFDATVMKEYEKLCEMEDTISKLSYYRTSDSILGLHHNGLHTWFSQTEIPDVYLAILYGWGNWEGDTELLTYYQIHIHSDSMEATIISDKIGLFKRY